MKIKALYSIIVLTILIMGCTSSPSSDKNWDGGKWEGTQRISPDFKFQSKSFIFSTLNVNYSSKEYFFYTLETKTTDDGDDVISPSEYSIYDVFYRTFDGASWSEERNLTSPNDDISSHMLSVITFNEKIYLFTLDSWVSDNSTFFWGSRTSMMTFDGNDWDRTTIILFDKELGSGKKNIGPLRKNVQIFVWDNKIWALWGTNRTEFGFKTNIGGLWGEQQNLSFPDTNISNDNNRVYQDFTRFTVFKDELWCTWVYFSMEGNHLYGNTDHSIYLGKFNGKNWDKWYKLNASKNVIFRPDIIPFNNEMIISWEGMISDGSERFNIFMKSYSEDKIGFQESVSPDGDGNYQVDLCVYKDKIYFVWLNSNSATNYNRIQIRSYGIDGFGKTKTISDYTHPSGDFPRLFTLKDKLWVYWVSHRGVGGSCINIRGYS